MLIAQATDAPAWLQGSLSVPFWAVGIFVGLVIMAGLLYFAQKASRTRQERVLESEEYEHS